MAGGRPVTLTSEILTQVVVAPEALDTPLIERARSVLGMVVLLGIAWALSTDRRRVSWSLVAWGVGLQFVLALFILKTPLGANAFDAAGTIVVGLLGFTLQGAEFVFGNLVYDTVPVGRVGDGGFAAAPGQVARTGAAFAFSRATHDHLLFCAHGGDVPPRCHAAHCSRGTPG